MSVVERSRASVEAAVSFREEWRRSALSDILRHAFRRGTGAYAVATMFFAGSALCLRTAFVTQASFYDALHAEVRDTLAGRHQTTVSRELLGVEALLLRGVNSRTPDSACAPDDRAICDAVLDVSTRLRAGTLPPAGTSQVSFTQLSDARGVRLKTWPESGGTPSEWSRSTAARFLAEMQQRTKELCPPTHHALAQMYVVTSDDHIALWRCPGSTLFAPMEADERAYGSKHWGNGAYIDAFADPSLSESRPIVTRVYIDYSQQGAVRAECRFAGRESQNGPFGVVCADVEVPPEALVTRGALGSSTIVAVECADYAADSRRVRVGPCVDGRYHTTTEPAREQAVQRAFDLLGGDVGGAIRQLPALASPTYYVPLGASGGFVMTLTLDAPPIELPLVLGIVLLATAVALLASGFVNARRYASAKAVCDVLNRAEMGALVIDEQGVILHANRHAETIFGVELPDLIPSELAIHGGWRRHSGSPYPYVRWEELVDTTAMYERSANGVEGERVDLQALRALRSAGLESMYYARFRPHRWMRITGQPIPGTHGRTGVAGVATIVFFFETGPEKSAVLERHHERLAGP